jgi:hypothetical protein
MRKIMLLAFFLCGVTVGLAFAQNDSKAALKGYDVKLTQPVGAQGFTFEDEFIKIAFPPNTVLDFNVLNKSKQPLEIDWQKASFTDIEGKSHRVAFGFVWNGGDIDSQPPTRLAPDAKINGTLVPAGFVSQASSESQTWSMRPLFHGGMEAYVNKPFTLVLPIKIGATSKEYSFTFVVEKSTSVQ